GGGHFAVAIVLEIAVFAALVAAIGDVEMDGERHAALESFAIEIGDKAHCDSFLLSAGSEERWRMPSEARLETRDSASRQAVSSSTSNSGQILFSTISRREVFPSAAFQM